MSFTSLPPELLGDILDQASGILPSHDWNRYKTRRANLRSYSLVHSSFRPIAQDLLPRETRREGPIGEDRMKIIVDGLAQDAFKDANVTHFHGGRKLTGWAGETGLNPIIKSWSNLVYLELGQGPSGAQLDFAILKFFPRTYYPAARHSGRYLTDPTSHLRYQDLESLRLHACEMSLGVHDLFLPKLRRLVFTNLTMPRGNLEGYRRFFSPQSMPNLRHLALGFLLSASTSQLFRDLGPQIKTLAVRLPGLTQDDLVAAIARYMPNLEHLSLSFLPLQFFQPDLFSSAAGLKLKTLHLNERCLGPEGGLVPRLLKVARGEKETFEVEEIWIYGSKRCAKRDNKTGLDMDQFRWVTQYSMENEGNGRKGTPPFFQFDGSPDGSSGA
ncbi:hypothetical protein JCM5353_003085 [Sporobolomyces roseus]